MESKKNTNFKKELSELHKEMKTIGPMMRGSITIMGKKNKQPYFSVGIDGKTKVIYLGNKRAEIAGEYVNNYKRMLELVDRMTIINMKILKSIKTNENLAFPKKES
jgi:hypothetical protein